MRRESEAARRRMRLENKLAPKLRGDLGELERIRVGPIIKGVGKRFL
jgi:hypothetical protein